MDRFRFTSPPFTREIKVEHRCKTPHLEAEVSALKNTVDLRQSAVVVAPAGAGKTVVLRGLRARLPEARYRTTYVKLSGLSGRDMCREIATAIGVTPSGHYPGLVRAIEEKLRSGYMDSGIRQVIIFDDAHEMRPAVLRLVRLLTNFDMDSKLVLSIVLGGQMPLKTLLLRDDLEDIRQRLVHCGELRLMSREETRQYIEHRLRIAGAADGIFDGQAIDAVFEITMGNMRAIDKLAYAALEVADEAERAKVDAADVAIARARKWM